MAEMDLNLLRVFDALMETGSVTGAAARLHLSAPATSRALARLRTTLGDPVLVRAGRGLVATPYAQRMAPRVRELLARADGLPRSGADDPSTWRRTFSIRINDGLSAIVAAPMMKMVTSDAPGIDLRFVHEDMRDLEPLRDGVFDIDVGIDMPVPPDITSTPLFTDHFVAVVAADSPLGRQGSLSLEDLARHPYISSFNGALQGPIDEALRAIGLEGQLVAETPSSAIAALMVLEGGVICLLPHLLTRRLIGTGIPLREHAIPLPLPEATIVQRWHRRLDTDPAARWIRGVLDGLFSDAA